MGNVLAESFAILRDQWPRALVSPEIARQLGEHSRWLVPLPALCVGLECRLGKGADRVDVQQGVSRDDGEPALLAAHARALVASSDVPLHGFWRRIGAVCAAWQDSSSVAHGAIRRMWLEFDDPPPRLPPSTPSIFLTLRRDGLQASDVRAAVDGVLQPLTGTSLSKPLQQALARCVDGCAPGESVAHVGLMLSRPGAGLRINVHRLAADRIIPFLQALDWPASPDALRPLIANSFSVVDAMTLCLDVGPEVRPRIGLECYLAGLPTTNPRWRAFLDALVGRNLCTPEKRDGLLDWPGYTAPGSSAAPWPDALIAASLTAPADRFGVLARKINHVKLVYQPDDVCEAKAYIGVVHTRLVPAADPDPAPPLARRPPLAQGSSSPPPTDPLSGAMEAAIRFLLDARTLGGWWCDFPKAAGWSDEWVTAFTAAAIAAVPDPRIQAAASHAWALLVERRPHGAGWGYSLSLPEDADSTTWGLRVALALGQHESPRARRARVGLDAHVLQDGGLSTYRDETYPRDINPGLIPSDGSSAGWCGTAHPCVTAAAAILGDERHLDFLRHAQRGDGSWAAYWWQDDEYSTALAADALAATGHPADRARVRAAVEWAAGRVASGVAAGSAFAMAWRVRALCHADAPSPVEAPLRDALAWLVSAQRADGAWPPSARLRVPRLDTRDPQAGELQPVFLDEAAIFTTAAVLSALAMAKPRRGNG